MREILRKIKENPYPELIARWVLGGVFVYASIHKIADPESFARIIFGYGLFPPVTINVLAIFVPFFELCTGLCLITGVYPRSAALMINAMLFLFILAVGANLIRGYEFDCGCFSIGESGYTSSATQLLFRNAILFLIGLGVFLYKHQRRFCLYAK